MTVKRQIRAEFWPVGREAVDCTVIREDDGRVRFSASAGSAAGQLFLKTEGSRRYGLGEFEVRDRIAERPRLLKAANNEEEAEVEATSGSNIIDSGATKRVNSLLQKTPGLRLEIKLPGGTMELRTVPLSPGSAASFFMVDTSGSPIPDEIQNVPAVLFLFGMQYVFRARIVDRTESQIAITLPGSYCRIVRRAILRDETSVSLKIISSSGLREVQAKDISYSGLCVSDIELKSRDIWSEVELQLTGKSGNVIQTHSLIVEQSDKGTHLLFCGGTKNAKDRFRLIHSLLNEGTELVEEPELVWNCLQQFNYLELLEPGKLEKVKLDCLETWKANIETDLSLLPVLKVQGQCVGTYGLFQGGIDHWYHHLLAIDFSPKALVHAATLYQVWANYLSSRSEHSWITAWYNPTKTWHNRFCQVFLKEHEKHKECITFDRHWFWLSQIDSVKTALEPCTTFVLDPINTSASALQDESLSRLRTWYPKLDTTAILPKVCRESVQDPANPTICHREYNFCITKDGRLVGNVLMFYTTQDLNPFSLTNTAHINIYDPEIKNSPELLQVITQTIALMKNLGFHRAAFTLDFDAPIQSVRNAGYTYFAVQRCISFTTRLLPEWLSNSALSFADLTGRIVA